MACSVVKQGGGSSGQVGYINDTGQDQVADITSALICGENTGAAFVDGGAVSVLSARASAAPSNYTSEVFNTRSPATRIGGYTFTVGGTVGNIKIGMPRNEAMHVEWRGDYRRSWTTTIDDASSSPLLSIAKAGGSSSSDTGNLIIAVDRSHLKEQRKGRRSREGFFFLCDSYNHTYQKTGAGAFSWPARPHFTNDGLTWVDRSAWQLGSSQDDAWNLVVFGSPAGNLFTQSLTASLSFVGGLATSHLFIRAFTATLFQSGGALATDNFNRANGPLGANWGSVTGLVDFSITSNAAGTSNNNNMANRYTAVAAPADQYSKVTLTALNASTNSGVGAAVRIASGAVTMYLIQGNTTETTMFKAVAGSFTQLGSTAAASAVNDILEIDAVGSTITGKKNGVTIIGPVTDATIVSGDYGIWASAIGFPALSLDNWEGGSPGGGPLATLTRNPFKSLTATFSPIAALTKKYLDAGFNATLSFIGNLTVSKTFIRALTATLSFTGNLAVSKLFVRAFTATLSFSGALSRRTGKALSATLSFTGAIAKNIPKILSATLSFIGNLAISKLFVRAFTATLSFAGNLTISKLFVRALTATLSFSGGLSRRTGKALSATLSFVGNLATNLIHGGGTLFLQSYSATLSFAGAFAKLPQKKFGAILSWSASLVRRVARAFSATLNSAGTLVKVIRDAGFSATLSFLGSLSTAVVHFFTKAFTATLSFAGAITASRRFARVLSATLNMTGVLKRQMGKSLAATLSFSVALRKTIRKGFTAILHFVGFIFKGGAVTIVAGAVTKCFALIGIAASSAKITKTESQLKIHKTESDAEIPLTSSKLKVERTE